MAVVIQVSITAQVMGDWLPARPCLMCYSIYITTILKE